MTPSDRERIAAMLRERLPGACITTRWSVHGPGKRVALAYVAVDRVGETVAEVYGDRTWAVSGTWDDPGPDGGPCIGRGWRERLVADVVAAVDTLLKEENE